MRTLLRVGADPTLVNNLGETVARAAEAGGSRAHAILPLLQAFSLDPAVVGPAPTGALYTHADIDTQNALFTRARKRPRVENAGAQTSASHEDGSGLALAPLRGPGTIAPGRGLNENLRYKLGRNDRAEQAGVTEAVTAVVTGASEACGSTAGGVGVGKDPFQGTAMAPYIAQALASGRDPFVTEGDGGPEPGRDPWQVGLVLLLLLLL